jgi:hypothetical protein
LPGITPFLLLHPIILGPHLDKVQVSDNLTI